MRSFCLSISLVAAGALGFPGSVVAAEKMRATWYGAAYAGKATASGEMFDPWAMTAAHPTLPLGTLVEVKHVSKGHKGGEPRRVVVRINDRIAGHGRIDLSDAAARALRIRHHGGGTVEVTPIKQLADAR